MTDFLKSLHLKYLLLVFLFLTICVFYFVKSEHIEQQGFNPTDDGVVIAQSWRILNGEIPHKDFISIRPAGSGYLHTIHFFSPLPLMVSARWFVLFQFCVIALIISFIIKTIFDKEYGKIIHPVQFLSLFTFCFALSSLNYNMYPWTTIDAVFWSSLSLAFIWGERSSASHAAGLIFISFAALSRQSFFLLAASAFIYVLVKNHKNPVKAVIVCLIGSIPFWAYLIMLLKHDSLGMFITQMTGRTELLETGVIQYAKRIVLSHSGPLYVIGFFLSGLLYIKRKSQLPRIFIEKSFAGSISLIFVFVALVHIIRYFLLPRADIFVMPFELFFILFTLTLLNYVLVRKFGAIHKLSIIVLFISWASSVSLGDNTPVFAAGLLGGTILAVAGDYLIRFPLKRIHFISSKIFLLVISFSVFILTVKSQKSVNYRDLGHLKISKGLFYASTEFGDIMTNPATLAYYSDLYDIFNALPDGKNNTVVIPNNPAFYPVFKTQNPAPLDWIQPDEYIGQEERLFEEILLLLRNEKTYFIIDKIDSKTMHEKISPVFYPEPHVANLIKNNGKEIQVNSDFFLVIVSDEYR